MNILFISQNFYPNEIGGYEIACRRLVQEFKKEARVRVLASSFNVHEKEKLYNVDYILDNVNNYGFDLKRRKCLSLLIRSYVAVRNYLITRKYIQNMGIDVVIAFQLDRATFTPLVACKDMGLPVVMDMGDLWWKTLCDQFNVHGWKKCIRRASHGFFTPQKVYFDRIICNSEYTAQEIRKVVKEDTATIHRHLPDFMFKHTLNTVERIDKVIITYGGRLCEEKGIADFIEIIEILCSLQPNRTVDARIIGNGLESYISFLKRLIDKKELSDKIQILPSVSQEAFFQHLCESHFFLFPFSWNEPFGQVVPQAMAAGAVPICSNQGGPATIIDNGLNGYLLDRLELGAFAQTISTLVDNLKNYNRIRQEGHAYALSNFSPEKVFEQYFSIVGSVVK